MPGSMGHRAAIFMLEADPCWGLGSAALHICSAQFAVCTIIMCQVLPGHVQDEYKPGALGFDPLGLYPDDPAEQYDIETKELNNGRLAMIGIAGFVAQELVDGKPLSQGLFKSINNKPGL